MSELDRPITIGEAVRLLDIPGPSTGAKAQRLRRLERDGTLPAARRSFVHGDRYYQLSDLYAIRQRLGPRGWPK